MKKNFVSKLVSPLQQIVIKKSQLLRPLIDASKSIAGKIISRKQMVVNPFIKQVIGRLKFTNKKIRYLLTFTFNLLRSEEDGSWVCSGADQHKGEFPQLGVKYDWMIY